MQELIIYDSLKGEKIKFEPIQTGHVGLYVCGPTVYNYVHLGNCRTFISFDLVYRYLKYIGYKVRYVRNITDAGHLENDAEEGEDKIAKKARLEQLEPMEIVQKYTLDFHDTLRMFNNLSPSIEPTATGHIIEQIQMTQAILDAGLAYVENGSVYFDVKKYDEKFNYGELSKRKIEELISGTRALEGQDEKRSPVDFALWKKATPAHIMKWPSPWSLGFPGWHLECSVMSTKYLGKNFDIHGGGMDLKFPHHECEIAQGKAANNGQSPVNYWMHGNMLTLNGKKMSKSTGNTLLPNELFTGEHETLSQAYHPIVVRFFILQAHYRSTLDFSDEALKAAQKGYKKLMTYYKQLDHIKPADSSNIDVEEVISKFYSAMNDDFNSPILVAHLFDASKIIHELKEGSKSLNENDLKTFSKEFKGFITDVLGLYPIEEAGDSKVLDQVMELIINLRSQARSNKDWSTSDQIRDELAKVGIQIKDGKEGTSYELNE